MEPTIDLGLIPVLIQPKLANGEIAVDPLECKAVADEVARRLLAKLPDLTNG